MALPPVSEVESPLTFFAVTLVICNTVFGICATYLKNYELFKYCIHMFLAIVGVFSSIVIWSPACLYPLGTVKISEFPYKPWPPTIFVVLLVMLYMVYHFLKWYIEKKNFAEK